MDGILHLLALGAIFLAAGAVKGLAGFGLPTLGMGLLALSMAPAEAAALLLAPSFVSNIWQLAEGGGVRALARRLWPMLLAALVATPLAVGLMTGAGAGTAARGLGAMLAVYALLGLFRVRLDVPRRAEGWAGPLVGAVTGALTGATGVFVVPAGPYLAGLGLDRDRLVQAMGLSFTVSTVGLGIGLALRGAVEPGGLGASLLAVAPALLGMWLGGRLRRRIPQEAFRIGFMIALLLLGGHILLTAG